MAKSAQTQVGMDKAELRPIVKLARQQEVHIAFALGGDGKAIVMMDKRKQPRAILKELKEQAAEARNHRFGSMIFDPENPKIARITVDKASSGMARKLVVAFKGTGVRQIQLMTEDGQAFDSAVNEEDDEEEGEGGENPAEQIADGFSDVAKGVSQAASGIGEAISDMFGGGGEEHHRHHHHDRHHRPEEDGDGQPQQDAETSSQADASSTDASDTTQAADTSQAAGSDGATDPSGAGDQQQYDGDALKTDLVGLVKRMMGVIKNDPSQKAALAELATNAQASLKRGDLAQASAGIDVFREALDGVENPDGSTDGSASSNAPSSDSSTQAADTSAASTDGSSTDPSSTDSPSTDATNAGASSADGSSSAAPGTDGASTDGSATAAANGGDGAPDGADQGATGPGAKAVQRYRKSRAVWQATRAKIDSDIQKLSKTITSMDHGGQLGDNLEQEFLSTIDPILSTLDDSLADILSTAEKAKSQDEAKEALDQARTTIKLYQTFVSSNETIQELDKNPFMPLALVKTLNASLQVLSAAMK